MSNQYDDRNNQMLPIQPAPVQSTGGFTNWVKNNKVAVAIALILLIFVIWWFCVKKNGNKVPGAINVTSTPNPTGTGSNIRITKAPALR